MDINGRQIASAALAVVMLGLGGALLIDAYQSSSAVHKTGKSDKLVVSTSTEGVGSCKGQSSSIFNSDCVAAIKADTDRVQQDETTVTVEFRDEKNRTSTLVRMPQTQVAAR